MYKTASNATGEFKVHQEIEYFCNEDFVIHPKFNATLTCNVTSGNFESLLPECERSK